MATTGGQAAEHPDDVSVASGIGVSSKKRPLDEMESSTSSTIVDGKGASMAGDDVGRRGSVTQYTTPTGDGSEDPSAALLLPAAKRARVDNGIGVNNDDKIGAVDDGASGLVIGGNGDAYLGGTEAGESDDRDGVGHRKHGVSNGGISCRGDHMGRGGGRVVVGDNSQHSGDDAEVSGTDDDDDLPLIQRRPAAKGSTAVGEADRTNLSGRDASREGEAHGKKDGEKIERQQSVGREGVKDGKVDGGDNVGESSSSGDDAPILRRRSPIRSTNREGEMNEDPDDDDSDDDKPLAARHQRNSSAGVGRSGPQGRTSSAAVESRKRVNRPRSDEDDDVDPRAAGSSDGSAASDDEVSGGARRSSSGAAAGRKAPIGKPSSGGRQARPSVPSSSSATGPAGRDRTRRQSTGGGAGSRPKAGQSPRVKAEATSPANKKIKVDSKSRAAAKVQPKRPKKVLRLTEENFEPINCWWDKEPHAGGAKWVYLEHHGMIFAPCYEPHNVPVRFAGRLVEIPAAAEEVVNYWCGALHTEHVQKRKYVENFWGAFLRRLPPSHPILTGELLKNPDGANGEVAEEAEAPGRGGAQSSSASASDAAFGAVRHVAGDEAPPEPAIEFERPAIADISNSKKAKTQPDFRRFDWTLVQEHLETIKRRKQEMSKEQKAELSAMNQQLEGAHTHCLFDWLRERVQNIKMEPPNLFRGRGEHPRMGVLKRRIFPEEVTLNLSEDAPVPRLPAELTGHSWKDIYHDNTVSWLAYYRDSVNAQYKYLQLAGGSVVKGKSDHKKYEKARELKDTIADIRKDYIAKMHSKDIVNRQLGTATYLIDFLALRIGNEKDTAKMADTVGCCSLRLEHVKFEDETLELSLDFLGKDSIRYFNTVKIDERAFENLKGFCKTKKPSALIFDSISTTSLNKYLKELMPGLSAKVFRTYNASITLQRELKKFDETDTDAANPDDIIRFYNDANRQVAILCNHQRSIPKAHSAGMDKLRAQSDRNHDAMRELEEFLKWLKSKSSRPFKFKSTLKLEDGEERKSQVKESMKDSQVLNKLRQLKMRQSSLELKMRTKDDNKTVATGTSKQHYMDPRITVAFAKTYEVPVERLFNKALQKNFSWAMYSPSTWEF